MPYRKSPKYTGFRIFDAISELHGVDFDAILFADDETESKKLARKMQKDTLKHWTAMQVPVLPKDRETGTKPEL